MPSSHIQRDASGRAIHLLNDTNETPTCEPHQSIASLYATFKGGYSSSHNGHMSNTSYPNTPDLTRSDSYDSQASGHGSPLTPASNGGFLEPLFSAKIMPSEHQPTLLPPISSLHAVAGTMEPKTPTTPELSRRTSSFSFNPYSTNAGASSSSSLEDFHYRNSMEAHDHPRRAVFSPEIAVHHSVETCDDALYPEQPLVDHRQIANRSPREEDEKPDSGRKGVKGTTKSGAQKRYPCKEPTCDKSFTTSGHASRHAKIHEGSKPIPCTFEGCPKRFTRQDNMKQHLETHRREKSRASAKQARRPSLATRRQSASSRGSASRFSTPRDTPPLLSPALQTGPMLSPGLSPQGWNRHSVASRTPSGLDALAMVAATEHQQQEAQREAESFLGPTWSDAHSRRY